MLLAHEKLHSPTQTHPIKYNFSDSKLYLVRKDEATEAYQEHTVRINNVFH